MMKKFLSALCGAAILLTGCGAGDSVSSAADRQYIPSDASIQANMQDAGYTVQLQKYEENGGISMLVASNGKQADDGFEGLYVIRSKESNGIEAFKKSQQLDKQIDNFRYIVYTNDEEYGNIMVCGTETAISDAGIRSLG